MSNQSTHRQNKNKGKVAERIAFDPFLPRDDLINEFIRNTINPNTDSGQTYYVGKIIDIIENSDEIIDNRDIFYSQSDNYERIVRASNDKKYNEKRKVLIIHVPSFFTSATYSARTKNINYSMFTKLRVEYRGKDEVKIGYIVKIQFGNSETYSNPEIISVQPAEAQYIDALSKPALNAHKKHEECRTLNLSFPVEFGESDVTPNIRPPGGYAQALRELDSVFSSSYIDAFIKTIKVPGVSETQFGKIENIVLKLLTVNVDPKVYQQYSKNNIKFLRSKQETQNTYLIKADSNQVLISCELPEKRNELRDKFYNYIKKDFDARLSFLFSFNNTPDDNSFVLDINLNLLEQKGNEAKTVDNYLKISNIFDKLNYFPFLNTASAQTEQQTQNSIIKTKTIVDKCDAELAKDKTIYPIVYDGKTFTNTKVTTEKTILEAFYKIPINDTEKSNNFVNGYLTSNYFGKLVGDKGKNRLIYSIDPVLDALTSSGVDSEFYKGPSTNDKYNDIFKGISIISVKNNLNKVSSFLTDLKNQIEEMEQYGTNSGRVLIVPIQVLKLKKESGLVPEGQDPNSRHYYGKAFDIRIFLKDFDENDPKKIVIKQMRPEIITLYANLVGEKLQEKLGQGLFLEENKRYNHIEFLGKTASSMGLEELEYNERLLYTTSVDDPLGKLLKESGPEDRIAVLKNQIRQNPIYISAGSGLLDPRFNVLTLPSST